MPEPKKEVRGEGDWGGSEVKITGLRGHPLGAEKGSTYSLKPQK